MHSIEFAHPIISMVVALIPLMRCGTIIKEGIKKCFRLPSASLFKSIKAGKIIYRKYWFC